MRSTDIHIAQSLRRSAQCLDDHSVVVGAVNHSAARADLDTANRVIESTVDEQGAHTRESHGEVSLRHKLERELIRWFLTPLSKFARVKLQGAPDYAALTPTAYQLRTERLVGSARSVATTAAKYQDELTAAMFPVDFLDRMRDKANAVEQSVDKAQSSRVKRGGATTKVKHALRSGRAAVATIDAALTPVLEADSRFAREWRTAKRITRGPIPSQEASTTTTA